MENCDICANDVFRDSWKQGGIERRAFNPPSYPKNKSAVPANSTAATSKPAAASTPAPAASASANGTATGSANGNSEEKP